MCKDVETFAGDVFTFAFEGDAKFEIDEDGDVFVNEDVDVKDEPNPPRFNAMPPLCNDDEEEDNDDDDDDDDDGNERGEAEVVVVVVVEEVV